MKMKWMLFLAVLASLLVGCAGVTATPESSSGEQPTQAPPLMSGVQQIGGVVLGGGDQTPEGLMDGPRTFLYQVRLESGEEINLTYTAMPPSPVGKKSPVRLTFFEGTINPGNYIVARGTYDADGKTLTVASEGDFIETMAKKP